LYNPSNCRFSPFRRREKGIVSSWKPPLRSFLRYDQPDRLLPRLSAGLFLCVSAPLLMRHTVERRIRSSLRFFAPARTAFDPWSCQGKDQRGRRRRSVLTAGRRRHGRPAGHIAIANPRNFWKPSWRPSPAADGASPPQRSLSISCDPENSRGRVAYAAQVIARGGANTRTFDSCFENSDGDEVAVAVVRRSRKNPRYDAIRR